MALHCKVSACYTRVIAVCRVSEVGYSVGNEQQWLVHKKFLVMKKQTELRSIPSTSSTFGSERSHLTLYDTKQFMFVYFTFEMLTMYKKSLKRRTD